MKDFIVKNVDDTLEIEGIVQELIRCKDCKHWAKGLGWCNITDLDVEPDFYCAYAERKEE